ncbi:MULTISPECIES: lipoyl domain-containing protein [Saccharopolyspora]|uniref:Lipoyl-binding domain-containing protein n=1 Tax=Saccharopolyspora gregorii TaxID=33914 RepID=A0ABP6RX14_9PSEU|nr:MULTISPECIES: lipoyl domain-containing protein [unclassified Saccharopolyspora]MCA1187994.1 lipoyl domain-containing protein [Saccharopolyspora sp. 6T]MCA1283094.1 lipoyl domain-containing protein [Saccharopolyspora sp. 7B]
MLGASSERNPEAHPVTDLHFPRPHDDPREPGSLARWLVPDGARVRSGAPVAEVVTDGAPRTVRAPASGTLWRQGRAGERFTAGAIIGLVE